MIVIHMSCVHAYGIDIIGFQEVRARKASPHNTSRYQVDDLLTMLPGYQLVAQPAMAFNEGDHGTHHTIPSFDHVN